MKKMLMLIALTALTICLVCPSLVLSQTGGTEQGQSNDRAGWYCPYCGSYMGPGYGGYGMGPGMMGPGYGRGYGMGPGMMGGSGGYGYGMGPGMMGPGYGYGPQYRQPPKPLEEKDAKAEVEDYLKTIRNPNLKVGSVKDTGNAYSVEILTKDNSLVNKILVDKNTGWMRSAY
jgi:hypothetical protein